MGISIVQGGEYQFWNSGNYVFGYFNDWAWIKKFKCGSMVVLIYILIPLDNIAYVEVQIIQHFFWDLFKIENYTEIHKPKFTLYTMYLEFYVYHQMEHLRSIVISWEVHILSYPIIRNKSFSHNASLPSLRTHHILWYIFWIIVELYNVRMHLHEIILNHIL